MTLSRVRFEGLEYLTVRSAAAAWAESALPDVSVIGEGEPANVAAEALVRFWAAEVRAMGKAFAPEDVDEKEWAGACCRALTVRIDFERAVRARRAECIAEGEKIRAAYLQRKATS